MQTTQLTYQNTLVGNAGDGGCRPRLLPGPPSRHRINELEFDGDEDEDEELDGKLAQEEEADHSNRQRMSPLTPTVGARYLTVTAEPTERLAVTAVRPL